MARFSVWNYRARAYDYYDAPDTSGTHVDAPPTPLVRSRLGATPDQAAWSLPTGAVKVGQGARAEGKVASLGEDLLTSSSVPWIAGGIAAIWYFWKKGR